MPVKYYLCQEGPVKQGILKCPVIIRTVEVRVMPSLIKFNSFHQTFCMNSRILHFSAYSAQAARY